MSYGLVTEMERAEPNSRRQSDEREGGEKAKAQKHVAQIRESWKGRNGKHRERKEKNPPRMHSSQILFFYCIAKKRLGWRCRNGGGFLSGTVFVKDGLVGSTCYCTLFLYFTTFKAFSHFSVAAAFVSFDFDFFFLCERAKKKKGTFGRGHWVGLDWVVFLLVHYCMVCVEGGCFITLSTYLSYQCSKLVFSYSQCLVPSPSFLSVFFLGNFSWKITDVVVDVDVDVVVIVCSYR